MSGEQKLKRAETHVPELPDEDNLKPVLMDLWVPPSFPLMQARMPDKNGIIYTKKALVRALANVKERIRQKSLFVNFQHVPLNEGLKEVVGLVDNAEICRDTLIIHVNFTDRFVKLLLDWGLLMHCSVIWSGNVKSLKVEDLEIEEVFLRIPDSIVYNWSDIEIIDE